jgi:site-specific DNA-methyltransferase (adenine-specific)
LFAGLEDAGLTVRDTITWHYATGLPKGKTISSSIHDHAENETSAGDWEGWNPNLKPATEFIALARKQFDGALYENCLRDGVGALNIDECRAELQENETKYKDTEYKKDEEKESSMYGQVSYETEGEQSTEGRYAANVVLSDGGAQAFEQQGKARYFNQFSPPSFKISHKASPSERTLDSEVDNSHPTVKPIDLMEWLVRLVTREGQTVLDPFAGSGTTALAAMGEERDCICIERDDDYFDILSERVSVYNTQEELGVDIINKQNEPTWEKWERNSTVKSGSDSGSDSDLNSDSNWEKWTR